MHTTITHSCGCPAIYKIPAEEIKAKFSDNSERRAERDRLISEQRKKQCAFCERGEKYAKIEGTEKQVAWADDIRKEQILSIIREAEDYYNRANAARRSGDIARAEKIEDTACMIEASADILKTVTNAKYFIDHCRTSAGGVIRWGREQALMLFEQTKTIF